MSQSEWKQVGGTWQRLYANGNLWIVYQCDPGKWLSKVYYAATGWDHNYIIESKASAKDVMDLLDAKHAPKPDYEDRTSTSTYYRKGERAALVRPLGDGKWTFDCEQTETKYWKGPREDAEKAALSHVLGGG